MRLVCDSPGFERTPNAVRMLFGPNKIGKLSANLAKLRLGEVTIRLGGCNCLARQPQTLSEKSTTYAGLRPKLRNHTPNYKFCSHVLFGGALGYRVCL